MILQTNDRLNTQIQKYGCGVMSLLFHAARYETIRIDGVRDIERIYKELLTAKIIKRDCYIRSWAALAHHVGFHGASARFEGADYICQPGEIEILRFQGHFTAGNGSGVVTYDPWGRSKAATKPLKDKRIITI